MTDEQLAELERLAAEATPGPWFVNPQSGEVCYGDPDDDRENYPVDSPEDAALCAASRAAVSELVAEVRRLRAERDAAAAAEQREFVSQVRDIARRIGVARRPESVKDDLDALADKYEFWARGEGG